MKTRRILIVEDDAFSRGIMDKLLRSYNYETFSCALAEEAIERLKQEPFSILITDLHLPAMDGFELIRNARTIRPGIHIIMVTGLPGDEIRSRAEEEGVEGFFSKPVDWDELYASLDILSRSGDIRNQDIPSNTRGKGTFQSAGIVLALILSISTLIGVQPSKAQSPGYPNRTALGVNNQDTCWKSPNLALTEAQVKELEKLQCAYAAEALPLVRTIRTLAFELRYWLMDKKTERQALIDHQKGISRLRTELENLSLSYQLRARSIYSSEQLDRLPQDCSVGLSTGYEIVISIGRAPRRRSR
jgi:CheY-like chemotaxis protein